MKRVRLIIICSLIIVICIFSYLLYKDIKYSNFDNTKYEDNIKKIDKEIKNKENEINTIKENNQEKVNILELWEKELEKAKNY